MNGSVEKIMNSDAGKTSSAKKPNDRQRISLSAEELTLWSCVLANQTEDPPQVVVERAYSIWETARQFLMEKENSKPIFDDDGSISYAEIGRQEILPGTTTKFITSNTGVEKAVKRCVDWLENEITEIGSFRGIGPDTQMANSRSLRKFATHMGDRRRMKSAFFEFLKAFQLASIEKRSPSFDDKLMSELELSLDLKQRAIVGEEL